jgi:hypothetical protein
MPTGCDGAKASTNLGATMRGHDRGPATAAAQLCTLRTPECSSNVSQKNVRPDRQRDTRASMPLYVTCACARACACARVLWAASLCQPSSGNRVAGRAQARAENEEGNRHRPHVRHCVHTSAPPHWASRSRCLDDELKRDLLLLLRQMCAHVARSDVRTSSANWVHMVWTHLSVCSSPCCAAPFQNLLWCL